MRSPKEQSLDNKVLKAAASLFKDSKTNRGQEHPVVRASRLALEDPEVQSLQEYANSVSIKRLGFNDHGPVHMRTVALNAIIMMGLLRDAGVKTSLEREELGSFEDSLIALILAANLHDLGMAVSRQDHEIHSITLAAPILDRLLEKIYGADMGKRTMAKSLAIECIYGHMGNKTIHSLEAGVVLIADGCDMTKGRARIPMAMGSSPKVGDIHKYSANSIEAVALLRGGDKPIRIEVRMSSEVGLFQVEEVLLGKIAASTAKGYVELFAQIQDGETKRYL